MPRLRLPICTEEAYRLLSAFYDAEVTRRGGICQLTDATLDRIWELAQVMTDECPKMGVMLVGSVGNGKTTLMRALNATARDLCDKGYIKAKDYGYTYSSDFGMKIYKAKDINVIAKTDWKLFESIVDAPMLGLDELGEEPVEVHQYRDAINPIVDLIEKRYDTMRFTMITSNLDPDEIYEKYGLRVADRLQEMVSLISFGNMKSFRQ